MITMHGVYCDHTVHFSTDLGSCLDSPMFWTPWHQSMSTYSKPYFFQFQLEERWGMDKCKLGVISQERLKIEVKLLLLSANRKSYMPRRLAQQRMTLSDLEWPFQHHHIARPCRPLIEIISSFPCNTIDNWITKHKCITEELILAKKRFTW